MRNKRKGTRKSNRIKKVNVEKYKKEKEKVREGEKEK